MSYSSRSASAGPHRRPVTASEVRSVVFTTTRMRLGYDVEEVDSFLDQVEWSMEQMVAEITRLQRQIADIDQAHAASLDQARMTAHNLLLMLGGTPGASGSPSVGQQPQLVAPQPPQMQPRRAANTPPPVWNNPNAAPATMPGAGAVINGPTVGAMPGGAAQQAPLALAPPPSGRPAANLPPPPGLGQAAAGNPWSFPPPRG